MATPPTADLRRPGCVTAYAILVSLSSGLYFLFILLSSLSGDLWDQSRTVLALVICVFPLFPIPLIAGVYQMAKWGQTLAVAVHTVGLVGILLFALLSLLTGRAANTLAGWQQVAIIIIGITVNGAITYWFTKNRRLFSQNATVQIGPIINWLVMGILLVIFLIAILALLGPTTGDVFSRIR